MAIIRPFRAWRYNEAKISDIHKKFSPLFDVVSSEELEALYNSPNNSIHLSVPRSLEESQQKLTEWKSKSVLKQDPLPGIYIYYQYFWLFGSKKQFVRKGFICMIRMDDADLPNEPGIVLHENIIASSVKDRTDVLRGTLLNVSPTHGLYEDPEHSLEQIMDAYMEHPVYEHIDYQGVINKVAIVQNKKEIDRFLETLKGKPVYLADGHHRYAGSLAYKKEQAGISAHEDPMHNYHLIYLTNLKGSDISILPIHRLVKTNLAQDHEQVLKKLKPYFEIYDVARLKSPLYEELKTRSGNFGMVSGKQQYIFKLKSNLQKVDLVDLPLPDSVKKLDYTLLHYLVFDLALGIPYDSQTGNDNISYVKDYARAMQEATISNSHLAFITPGLSLQDMLDVCNAGSLMPQKSTYFYPKVICGLVFASIDENENLSPFDSRFRLTSQS